MPALIFYRPQTSDSIGFPELLAFGARKRPVHIGRNTQRLLRVALHKRHVNGVATMCFTIGLLCKLYGSARPGLYTSRLARAVFRALHGYSSNGPERVELPVMLADLVW
jgi:hypothetical protein